MAVNSFSTALLTLLVSNQFVELKSAVFKKFGKENLFQLSCTGRRRCHALWGVGGGGLCMAANAHEATVDILERFQLSIFLAIIAFRNVTEASASLDPFYLATVLLLPLLFVYATEILVDWLKHSFITKLNTIHPDVYLRFMDALARDFEANPQGVRRVPCQSQAKGPLTQAPP